MPSTHRLWWQLKACVWGAPIINFIGVAQPAEHQTLNLAVAGSSPTVGVPPVAATARLLCASCASPTLGVCDERVGCLPK